MWTLCRVIQFNFVFDYFKNKNCLVSEDITTVELFKTKKSTQTRFSLVPGPPGGRDIWTLIFPHGRPAILSQGSGIWPTANARELPGGEGCWSFELIDTLFLTTVACILARSVFFLCQWQWKDNLKVLFWSLLKLALFLKSDIFLSIYFDKFVDFVTTAIAE